MNWRERLFSGWRAWLLAPLLFLWLSGTSPPPCCESQCCGVEETCSEFCQCPVQVEPQAMLAPSSDELGLEPGVTPTPYRWFWNWNWQPEVPPTSPELASNFFSRPYRSRAPPPGSAA